MPRSKLFENNKDYLQWYYLQNKEKLKERSRVFYYKNREDRVLKSRARYDVKKAEILLKNKEYKKRNSHKVNHWNAKRRAQEKKATPSWANELAIIHIYQERDKLTALTGKQYQVDHIVPLKGRNVCGLHVEYNLQIILAIDNFKKNNKHE